MGTLTDKQKYEAELLKKDARIKELELELIIAKKWPPGIHAIQSTKYTDSLWYPDRPPRISVKIAV